MVVISYVRIRNAIKKTDNNTAIGYAQRRFFAEKLIMTKTITYRTFVC